MNFPSHCVKGHYEWTLRFDQSVRVFIYIYHVIKMNTRTTSVIREVHYTKKNFMKKQNVNKKKSVNVTIR